MAEHPSPTEPHLSAQTAPLEYRGRCIRLLGADPLNAILTSTSGTPHGIVLFYEYTLCYSYHMHASGGLHEDVRSFVCGYGDAAGDCFDGLRLQSSGRLHERQGILRGRRNVPVPPLLQDLSLKHI